MRLRLYLFRGVTGLADKHLKLSDRGSTATRTDMSVPEDLLAVVPGANTLSLSGWRTISN